LEFEIPSRGLIGLRSQMLTNTAGEAVMAHRFTEYNHGKVRYREEIMEYCFQKSGQNNWLLYR
jgi:predicted membrane GTPase involved in stress response